MLESGVEEYFRLAVIAAGGRCEKVVDLTRNGHPDREVQWPDPRAGIDKVELKRPDGQPESHQTRYHQFYARCGIPVYVIDTKEKANRYIFMRRHFVHAHELFSVPVPNL